MEDEAHREFDVGVTFYGEDFALTVRWTTGSETDDETRVVAAAEWFTETYGFDPAEHAQKVTVEPL